MMKPIEFIVVHVTDTPNDREVTAAEVHQWHLRRGWSGIGYNELIRRSGLLDHGRPPYWQGAHVRDFDGDGKGDNSDSIGIVLVGRDRFTNAQWKTLAQTIARYLTMYPDAQVVGHCDLDSRKTCPNFNVSVWWHTQGRHLLRPTGHLM